MQEVGLGFPSTIMNTALQIWIALYAVEHDMNMARGRGEKAVLIYYEQTLFHSLVRFSPILFRSRDGLSWKGMTARGLLF